ncbi:MAG: hypothetical protein ACYC0X_15070 [Pirellulaceae bacterium]
MNRIGLIGVFVLCLTAVALAAEAETVEVWKQGEATASLVLPDGDERAAHLVQATFARYLGDFYGVTLPSAKRFTVDGLHIVVGTPENNASLARLVRDGLRLSADDIGDEGFQVISHGGPEARYIVIYGRTPRALKYGCQELVFYHMPATEKGGQIEWPMNVVMKPDLAYRGIYMLPCWSAHDSIESWKRVLRFNSELTLNRTWFWLDGFPLAGHPAISQIPGQQSDFDRTPLADERNVQSLIDQVHADDMRFYIGGGWMSWHHEQVVGKDRQRAREYYFAYLKAFRNVGGFYFEPTGECSEAADWRVACDTLREMVGDLLERDPTFEVAVAIGRFNNREYLKLMSGLDPKRAYWWWCWGDPHADKALEMYPSVLGWHTTVRMSEIHGTVAAPSESETKLAGMSTSYDPGMGYGNPWTGWPKMGVDKPRDFDPYSMPYFSHEYRFREHCWNTRITDAEFSRRLNARLFDADMPAGAIGLYLKLADFCFVPSSADELTLSELEAFVKEHQQHGTARNRDSLARMREALEGIRITRISAPPAAK